VANDSPKPARRIFPRIGAPAVICAILLGISLGHAQITEDDPGLQAAKNLVVMINGSLGQGAGIIFAVDDGYAYIATMFHVVRQREAGGRDDLRAKDVTVRFYQRQRTPVPAEHLDDASYDNDLAVIRARVNGLTFDLNRRGDPQNLKKGDFVYAIGQPGGEQWGVTYQPGSISDVGSVWLKVQSAYVENGHSGGALIDQHGRIVGMVKQTGGSTPQALRIDRSLDILRLDLKLPVQLETVGELTNLARVAPAPVSPAPPVPGESRANPKDGLTYRWIPPGTFRMGCSEQPEDLLCDKTREFPTHDVTISKGFWMGETEVTQEAYERVTGRPISSRSKKGPRLPVVFVSWDEARTYCAAAGGMRLPTEAEWEYAVRAGTRSASYGDLSSIAWHKANSVGGFHEVGLKAANAWNLRDMLGNVYEWTADWYAADYYKNSPSTDPQGPTQGEYRVLRGSTFRNTPEHVRVSLRLAYQPLDRFDVVGFRCAGELR
jgi:formylglycine-generating enzyme required for sulfatase activity